MSSESEINIEEVADALKYEIKIQEDEINTKLAEIINITKYAEDKNYGATDIPPEESIEETEILKTI
jgi:hypothetical protein